VSNAQGIAVERQDGVIGPQAFVRFAQPLELALRIEVGDFRSLDLDERLINRTQGFVELRTDRLDIPERELDGVQVCAQTFVASPDRVESARDLQRLRFSISGLIARHDRAQTGDDGAGIGGGGLFPRLIANGEGSRVFAGVGLFLNSFPKPYPWRRPRSIPGDLLKRSQEIQPITRIYRRHDNKIEPTDS
jgi:hypothetical protein